ncbi:hypothetical protein [Helicobacter pylori]|uniref:hypothetical protein n=1 Tax=Helicobacter pylori TaxID=210 RepID=UPI0013CE32FB|nr:hypothetical protein [Helicobacter pylori]
MAHFIFSVVVVLLCLIGLFLLLCAVSSSCREGCLGAVVTIGICIAFPPFIIVVIIYLIFFYDDDDDD